MNLEFCRQKLYRVKRGQTVREIALAFGMPPRVLAAENGLTKEAEEGQILMIPQAERNLYVVQGGESMSKLCGSKENFTGLNKTERLYPSQVIFL